MKVGVAERRCARLARVRKDRPHPGFMLGVRERWRALTTLEDAQHWDRLGFSPEEAAPWIGQGVPATAALTWMDGGFDPSSARSYIDRRMSPIQAAKEQGRDIPPRPGRRSLNPH